MKILYVTARPPYPPKKGDQLIAYEQIKILGKKHEIYLLSLDDGLEEEEQVKEELRKYCKEVHILKGGKDVKRVLRTLYNGVPLQVNLFYDPKLQKQMEQLVGSIQPEVIHVQTIRLAEYFRRIPVPKVLDMIDAMSLNMQRRGEKESFPKNYLYLLEAFLLKKYEEKMIDLYDGVMLVSEKDGAHYQKEISINPNGTYITKELVAKYDDQPKGFSLVFHGNMQYFPNVEAVQYFCKEIFPRVQEKYPALRLYIVGRDPVKEVQELHNGKHIIVTGGVEDMVQYLTQSLIGVYPLNAGTGMQNKILEALACKLPTVASPLAVQGIPHIEENKHLLLARTEDQWVEKISILIEEESLRRQYGEAGQQLILQQYSWEKNAEQLLAIWTKALERRKNNNGFLCEERQ